MLTSPANSAATNHLPKAIDETLAWVGKTVGETAARAAVDYAMKTGRVDAVRADLDRFSRVCRELVESEIASVFRGIGDAAAMNEQLAIATLRAEGMVLGIRGAKQFFGDA